MKHIKVNRGKGKYIADLRMNTLIKTKRNNLWPSRIIILSRMS